MIHTSLFYKEWIKSRWFVFSFLLLLIAILAYSWINLNQLFRIEGAVSVWANVVLKDSPLTPAIVMYFPLLSGILLGLIQYIPEMIGKRLKLTLHLPLPEVSIVVSMLTYGLIVLLGLFVVFYLGLVFLLQAYFPIEVVSAFSLKALPWLLGGITAYLFSAWVCLEPNWKQRICNTIVGIAGLTVFYMQAKSGAYAPLLIALLITWIISLSFPLYSTSRFKEGVQ